MAERRAKAERLKRLDLDSSVQRKREVRRAAARIQAAFRSFQDRWYVNNVVRPVVLPEVEYRRQLYKS